MMLSSVKSLSETRDPVRTLKIAAPLGVTLVGVLYLLANISYFAAVPKDEILGSGRILAASFFRNVFGDKAERVLSIFVAFSAFGNVLAVLFSQGRSMYCDSERLEPGFLMDISVLTDRDSYPSAWRGRCAAVFEVLGQQETV